MEQDLTNSHISSRENMFEFHSENDFEYLPTYLPHVRSRLREQIGTQDQITNEELLLAATLVADAMEGQYVQLKREPKYIRSYNRFKSVYLRYPLYAAIMGILMLAVFEKPALVDLPYQITMAVEGVCLLYFIFRISHQTYWKLHKGYKREYKLIALVICIIITVVDMIIYAFVAKFTNWKTFRMSRILRPLIVMGVSDGMHLKRAWGNIQRTSKQIAHVIVLFFFLILMFSLVAMKLFQHRYDIVSPDGTAYFKNYVESFWNMYVLVTTANNPDVMIPAYNQNAAYCFFFTMHIFLCLYLMLNILLAVTYNSYRENMKAQIKYSARMKMKSLHKAFEVIKVNVQGKEMVTYQTWTRLIQLAHPGKTKHERDLLMMVLDTDKSGYLSREHFLDIADLLNVPISEVSERKTFLEIHCPAIYMSRISLALMNSVKSIYFMLIYDGIVIVNIVVICINVDNAQWLFLVLYIFEILLKWYTFGTQKFFVNFLNWTDVIITLVSLAVQVVTDTGQYNSEALSVVNMLRIFRILRCLVKFDRFRIIFDAVWNVSYSIFTYCEILFCIFYIFAILGMDIFGNKVVFMGYNGSDSTPEQINCNNSALNGSAFSHNRYCKINYNNLFYAFVVLASLLIVNNWQIICDGFSLVTSKYARIYFISFHLCVTVVVMSIVTAFILDMFIYEYTKLQLGLDNETGADLSEKNEDRNQKPEGKDVLNIKKMVQKITLSTAPSTLNLSTFAGITFHIKRRGWTKTELLLQQLFALEGNDLQMDSRSSATKSNVHQPVQEELPNHTNFL